MARPAGQQAVPGSPYQRGMADSYYGRVGTSRPHKAVGFKKIFSLTREEKLEYYRGIEDNEEDGDFKDFGTWR